ncbi:BlaI/MecI/CopY family transcriptional regulator [Maricaulis maris]|uniref:CopY family transcriptional repressor n=1 Tax=Maricaulis maris TaxID=74318 RepID=A0A495DF56_9PROT|nr:BlaI/MecI/CopY family transcriptional regulator [Maricaulis maris]RKR00084.1 CopY family transcriptional repressor [Maricaulis maris]
MARPTSPQLTDAEQRIMTVLWERGEASVRDITDALSAEHGLAYTTVLTTIRIMTDKGYVGYRKSGRAHIYAALLSRDGARNQALGSLVRTLFGGSAQSLAQHLVRAEKLTLDDIEALRAAVLEGDGTDRASRDEDPDGEAR